MKKIKLNFDCPTLANGWDENKESSNDAIILRKDGKYYLGVGYRLNNMVSIMAGFEWQWLRIGYCYDVSVGPAWSLTSSTHEVMLSFAIPTKKPVTW